MLFAHLKRLKLGRLRLRGPCGALAAIAQSLLRLAKRVVRPPPMGALVPRKRCDCQCHCLKRPAAKWSGRRKRFKVIETVASFFPSPTSATKSTKSRSRLFHQK